MNLPRDQKETDILVAKVQANFAAFGKHFPTGVGGVSRAELRWLERRKLLKSSLIRLDSGTMIRVWSRR